MHFGKKKQKIPWSIAGTLINLILEYISFATILYLFDFDFC